VFFFVAETMAQQSAWHAVLRSANGDLARAAECYNDTTECLKSNRSQVGIDFR
jgi:hypothetical protein